MSEKVYPDWVQKLKTTGTTVKYDPDAYYAMIDKHFQTQYQDCDYNICPFMSEEVRNNRFYETCC